VIIVAENRPEALARLDVFVGEWAVEARFGAGEGPQARSRFEWILDGRFLLQRIEIPVPEAPDGLMIVTRESPDFTPLDFRQRFTGTFSDDGNTISGAWETGHDSGEWERDFALTYRRIG
jgi:hypothetical protein